MEVILRTVRTGRKYLGPDKNITSIHKEFLDKYQEYNYCVSYSFFAIYSKIVMWGLVTHELTFVARVKKCLQKLKI
jgi:hypothetical protein